MKSINVFQSSLARSGADWVFWLLAGLGFLAIAVAVERLLAIRAASEPLDGLMKRLEPLVIRRDWAAAKRLLAESRSAASAIARAGLHMAPRGTQAAEKAMAAAAVIRRKRLEVRVSFLGTLGNNAPFVGLLGTVIGIVNVFDQLGRAQSSPHAGSLSAGIMSGVSEALVATAFGIVVALPSVALYNYLQRCIADILDDAEAISKWLTAYVSMSESSSVDEGMLNEVDPIHAGTPSSTRTSFNLAASTGE